VRVAVHKPFEKPANGADPGDTMQCWPAEPARPRLRAFDPNRPSHMIGLSVSCQLTLDGEVRLGVVGPVRCTTSRRQRLQPIRERCGSARPDLDNTVNVGLQQRFKPCFAGFEGDVNRFCRCCFAPSRETDCGERGHREFWMRAPVCRSAAKSKQSNFWAWRHARNPRRIGTSWRPSPRAEIKRKSNAAATQLAVTSASPSRARARVCGYLWRLRMAFSCIRSLAIRGANVVTTSAN
jgi:hypothetical protein